MTPSGSPAPGGPLHHPGAAYPDLVQRAIVGYHQDDQGDWVAELACGHQQHVRHEPPFYTRPWVLRAESRQQQLGKQIECLLCDQEGGESACYAHLVCPGCGIVLDGSAHRPGCASAA